MPPEPSPRPARSPRTPRQQEVVDVARALLDAEGADALTMRRLAAELGIRAPSLYKHVRDKATIEALLVEDALTEVGEALHAAVARPGAEGPVGDLLAAYRRAGLDHPHRYRLATGGPLRRDLLPPGLEDWAGEPFLLAVGEPYRAQALWSLAHGMVILEIDGRYPAGTDLALTWQAATTAFTR